NGRRERLPAPRDARPLRLRDALMRIRGRVLQPRSPHEVTYHHDGVVTIEGGLITAVEPLDGLPVDLDVRPHVIAPGFVDAHLHAPQTSIVGSATGSLLTWLQTTVFPAEAELADPVRAAALADAFTRRLLAAGTTLSFVYGSVHEAATDALFAALKAVGVRAVAGPVWMDTDCPEALKTPPEVSEAMVRGLVERWHGDRLKVAVIPRFALSCTPAALSRAGRLARELGLPVSTHLAETIAECTEARRRFGTADYLQVYEDAGLVHDRSVLAHCIHLSDGEWDRLAQTGATVAHCPDSNDFLGSGGMPVAIVRSQGVPVSLGTDIGAGRSFAVYRTMSYAFDNARRQGVDLELSELWWWGTRGGALALGETGTGALEPGLAADLVVLEVPDTAHTAVEVMQHVVFDHDVHPVRQVFVAGQAVGSG
ncbi:MAG: guanine deaminase, partial [Myxococcota bacterium]